jgi:hypothetical protein
MELVARGVALAVQIEYCRDARDAERDVRCAQTPRAAERVRDDDADLGARAAENVLTEASRRRIRVEREQHDCVRAFRIRRINSRRSADEAVARLGNDQRWPRPNDFSGLAQDQLHPPGVAVPGELACTLGGCDCREVEHATLDLRDGLLGNDEHVVVFEATGPHRGVEENRPQVVPVLQLRDAPKRNHAHSLAQPSPVSLMPAWHL